MTSVAPESSSNSPRSVARTLLAAGLVMPAIELRVGDDTTWLPGIALLAGGFLGLLWGNPAWLAWVPLVLARRAHRDGRREEALENVVVFAGVALLVLVVPFTVNRPIWGATTYWIVGTRTGAHTRSFFAMNGSELSIGAWLLVGSALASAVDLARTIGGERRILRRVVARGTSKLLGIVAASILLRAAVLSPVARYDGDATVPGSVFFLFGLAGPFTGHFGWFANVGSAAAWWGVLASSPTWIRRGGLATVVAWVSCASLYVLGMPGDEGIWLEHPSLQVGFVYWTAALAVPFVVAGIVSRMRWEDS